MEIRLAGITQESIVDGPGLRLVVFTQGCPHNCNGCHNPDTHDPNGGYVTELTGLYHYIEGMAARNTLLRGVTFSGGEPFLQSKPLALLAKRLRTLGLDIVVYSGFTFEQLATMAVQRRSIRELLEQTELLIDGVYKANERDLGLAFRGSRNQRLVDVRATLAVGRVVLWEDLAQKRWA